MAGQPARAELELGMVERVGCAYCVLWDREIAPIWPKTREGRTAPLRRIDLDANLPGDVRFASRPRFTPTFVLLRDGLEIGRLEGYPGEDFFWGLIGAMLQQQPEWAQTDEDEGG
ncbi:hypothetical protein CCR90_10510 [Rhodovulum sulfidophilum]|nr:hypothetical protein [Rhodovulum sulfidophilum]MBL3551752.1 hypothetical protein [Rhodovulum sulfidophilum]NDK34222.1 hypothetical protein [Rhodovulum sulfidophilum]OLS50357.1 hypothetical protein BV379_07815 [Rhodovulum sulfidophilum]OLS54059.1 hypothetical protein BV392_09855 [Rhodovulum sulfidophilum]